MYQQLTQSSYLVCTPNKCGKGVSATNKVATSSIHIRINVGKMYQQLTQSSYLVCTPNKCGKIVLATNKVATSSTDIHINMGIL